MGKRNFSEDLTAILVAYDCDSKNIKLPVKTTESQRNMNVNVLDLSKRSENVLAKGKIETIQDIINNYGIIKEIKGSGETTIKEIKNKFLQWWYENIDEAEVKRFWKEFVKVNRLVCAI